MYPLPIHVIENEGFSQKTRQMFSVHTTQAEFENSTFMDHVRKNPWGKSRNYCDAFVLEKLHLQNVSSFKQKRKPGVPFLFRFRDGFAWMEGLT